LSGRFRLSFFFAAAAQAPDVQARTPTDFTKNHVRIDLEKRSNGALWRGRRG
jgi:hypothetical protein